MRISLLDITGETAEVFERSEIPFTRLPSIAAVDGVDQGLVIVGEGVSLRQQRGLIEALQRAAQRGVSVLCLAPSEGDFDLTQPNESQSAPLQVEFEQAGVLQRYDKRFALLPTISPLAIESRKTNVVVKTAAESGGWSWLSMTYAAKDSTAKPAKLIVCGFGLIRDWDTSPVPRYLLVRLFDDAAAIQLVQEKEYETHLSR